MKKYKTSLNFLCGLLVFQVFFVWFSNHLYSQGNNEKMHPQIIIVDEQGNAVSQEKGVISFEKTCGKCHDTQYINNHNSHFSSTVKADCGICHLIDGQLGTNLNAVHWRIQLPQNENCAQCHGIIQESETPLTIPSDYEENLEYQEGKKNYKITQQTGIILASQDLSHSFLNLKDKEILHLPWDVHLRRQLDCIGCHIIGNDPRYCGRVDESLNHLKLDPRKVKSPGETLKRPDHHLKAVSCTCCHDAFKVHKNLPYKKRHMEVLSCQSCHVPKIYGPAFQSVDYTVVKMDGTPRIEYRGSEENKSHGSNLNTKYLKGFQPSLFAHRSDRGSKAKGKTYYKISPFNLVTYWFWKSGVDNKIVSESLIKRVFLGESGSQYTKEIMKIFDANKDQILDNRELILNEAAKINLIKEKLIQLGIRDPIMVGEIRAFHINHGVIETVHMKRDCSACHAPESKFGADVLLAHHGPLGVLPRFSEIMGDPQHDTENSIDSPPGEIVKPDNSDGNKKEITKNSIPVINGEIIRDLKGAIILKRKPTLRGHYIFGHSRIGWVDQVGLWVFLLALILIALHGIFRYISSRKHKDHQAVTQKVYLYRFYERLWHWTMATAIIILAITGLEIHYTGNFTLMGLEKAVILHNILAAILVINAFLSLFYHLTTGEIKQFFKFNRKFIKETLIQVYFYINGIFKRAPHPIKKTSERKLNPLQQLTYIGLLNVLLPFQVITGLLIWGADKWPSLSETLGGLIFLAPLHNLGSWIFLSFLVVHIYLTTTGYQIFSNIRAMITGWDDLEEGEIDEKYKQLMDLKVLDLVGSILKRKNPNVEVNK